MNHLKMNQARLEVCLSAEIAQLVEHHLAKVGVAGPSPVFRSILQPQIVKKQSAILLQEVIKEPIGSSINLLESLILAQDERWRRA